MPEIIMILIMIVILAIPSGIIVGLAWYFSARSKAAQAPPARASIQDRLLELDALRSKNLISETEYQEKRKQLLGEI